MAHMSQCKQCGQEFSSIGRHWYASSSCNFPEFTQREHEVITGLLMGDACVDNSTGNPYLVVNMTNKKFLDHLDEFFGRKSNGVSFMRSGEEQAEQGVFSDNPDNYSDQYRWKSVTNPNFESYREWYSSGRKVFPKDIFLTTTIMKYWYVCDGTFDTSGHQRRISIAASNEIGNRDKIDSYFEESSAPKPSNWNISERSSGGKRANIYWTKKDTVELFKFMGKPLPGFGDKWPDRKI